MIHYITLSTYKFLNKAVNYTFGDKPADDTGRGSAFVGALTFLLLSILCVFAVWAALWLCFLLGFSM